jgi:hypothetical protein
MIGYFRVKRFEMSVRASRAGGPPALTAEDMQRDIALRRNLEEVFGISAAYESEAAAAPTATATAGSQRAQAERLAQSSVEMRLMNDLQAAGLI